MIPRILDLGFTDYETALARQEAVAAARRRNAVPDTLILTEHPPVYTLGRNADPANIRLSPAALHDRSIPVVRASRGGQVTYHGPGQLIGYPIVRLGGGGRKVARYIARIEDMLIAVLAGFGVTAATDPVNPGVWVGPDKIAALGIRVSGGVSMHGFSLNVNTDLDAYNGIIPCGIIGRGVTSLHRFRPDVTLADVKPAVIDEFCSRFGHASPMAAQPERI